MRQIRRRYYDLLQLPPTASKDDIKRAYRKLALKSHPDKKNDDDSPATITFQEINEAYTNLIDDDKRRLYDIHGDNVDLNNSGNRRESGVRFGFGFGNRGQQQQQTQRRDFFDLDALFKNAFSSFQNGNNHHPFVQKKQPEQRPDIKRTELKNTIVDVTIDAAELRLGVSRTLAVVMQEGCTACVLSGVENESDRQHTCAECNGSGRVLQHVSPFVAVQTSCGSCAGLGNVPCQVTKSNACKRCGGMGTRDEKRAIHVKLPAGVSDGKTYTLKNGSNSGDLIVRVVYDTECKGYRINYSTGDVHLTVRLELTEVLTGFKKNIRVMGEDRLLQSGRGGQDRSNFNTNETAGKDFEKKPFCRYTDPSKPVVIQVGGLPPVNYVNTSARGNFVVDFDVTWPNDDEAESEIARKLRKYADVVSKILMC